ncbi:MAG: type II asparaginase [Acidobacteria bacterium]|jgi:L-asparaginase|nr:type II asparaginase [Acidobacteriota bacterium]
MRKHSALLSTVALAAVLAVAVPALAFPAPQAAAPAAQASLPKVVILATGGTIAGVQPKEGDPGYKSGSLSIESLIGAAPGVDKLAVLEGEQIASIGSQDMNDAVWLKLARRVNEVLARPDVAGIVITHGTDTLEETGFFLGLVTKSDKPVVLVGSMRPATSTSPDGPLNLYNGVAVAADPAAKGLGILVVANDDLHSARYITKTNTTDVQTFISTGRGALGEAYYGKMVVYGAPSNRHTTRSEFSLDGLTALPRVDIVYAYENVDGTQVKAAVAAGARGIVLAGVGDGNGTQALIDALAEAAKQGVVVVRSSRVGSGIVRRNIELNDDKLGFVAGVDLNPPKARVLLRLALTRTTDVKAIQRAFEEY